ncbi:hypothetical protein [Nocardia sp. NPDC049707]|uniref:hypothetical protein n=1 Tax=Nocardia sp. NPDC049707 TaxID=3154735 RepID=UPI00342A389B
MVPVPSTLAEDEVMAAVVPGTESPLIPPICCASPSRTWPTSHFPLHRPGGGAPAHRDGEGTEAGTALPRCSAGHLGCLAARVPTDARSMTSRAGAIVRTC